MKNTAKNRQAVANATFAQVLTGWVTEIEQKSKSSKKFTGKNVETGERVQFDVLAVSDLADKLPGDEETTERPAPLVDQVLGLLESGDTLTSREIVLGLGRTPGGREGGPVVRALHSLAEAGKIGRWEVEGSRGYSWSIEK